MQYQLPPLPPLGPPPAPPMMAPPIPQDHTSQLLLAHHGGSSSRLEQPDRQLERHGYTQQPLQTWRAQEGWAPKWSSHPIRAHSPDTSQPAPSVMPPAPIPPQPRNLIPALELASGGIRVSAPFQLLPSSSLRQLSTSVPCLIVDGLACEPHANRRDEYTEADRGAGAVSTREASIHLELLAPHAASGDVQGTSSGRSAGEPEVGHLNAGGQAARFVRKGDRLSYVDGVATQVRCARWPLSAVTGHRFEGIELFRGMGPLLGCVLSGRCFAAARERRR